MIKLLNETRNFVIRGNEDRRRPQAIENNDKTKNHLNLSLKKVLVN